MSLGVSRCFCVSRCAVSASPFVCGVAVHTCVRGVSLWAKRRGVVRGREGDGGGGSRSMSRSRSWRVWSRGRARFCPGMAGKEVETEVVFRGWGLSFRV